MNKEFWQAVIGRRTYYGISKELPIPEARILEIIRDAVKYNPSAFNSQSARVALLTGRHHDRLWDITMEILRGIVPADKFRDTEEKIQSFRNGYGTVLYFEDQNVVKGLQEKFPAYHENFPVWSQQSSGMLQYIVWTAFENEGLGVSLQHYNPLIDEKVKDEWEIPDHWKLIGEMPFGKPTVLPNPKDFQPLEERIKFFCDQK